MSNFIKSIIIVLGLLLIGFTYYTYKTSTYVTAEFKRLRPFQNGALIYLNGFKIGKVVKVSPNKNYTSSIIKMKLSPKDLKLPINIEVDLKKKKNWLGRHTDYVDIIYPNSPSIYYLEDGDRISGKITVDLDYFLSNQNPESLEGIMEDVSNMVKHTSVLIKNLNDVVNKIKPDILAISSNIKDSSLTVKNASVNVHNLTKNIETSITEEKITATSDNALVATDNLVDMTNGINSTISQLNCSLCELNKVLYNVEGVTGYLNSTLTKPLGGFKMLLGKQSK